MPYPVEWVEEGGIVLRYRVWFNRVADPENAWVVQELADKRATLFTGPGVKILGSCETKLDMSQTPQGWLECAGQLSRDGTSNFMVIR
jgi:hypothetical protein